MGFRTQRDVDQLKAPADRVDAYFFDDDCQGLSVRFQAGKSSWVVHYRAGEVRRRVTLGSLKGLRLKDAREKATRIVQEARDGKDVLAERRKTRAKAADSLRRLIDLYLARYAKTRQRPRTYLETERMLLKACAPLHDRAVEIIGRRDVADLLATIANERGGVTANRARAQLRAVFSWAMRGGLAEANPVIGTEPPAQERSRERVLSEGELAEVWRAAEGMGEFGIIVRLLLLTGQRRDEVAGMRWSELDLAHKALWSLPGERTKNHRSHEVPLSTQALKLLAARLRRSGRDLLFGEGKGPFSGWSNAKARLDAQILKARYATDPEATPPKPWVLHDLRRSMVTHMAELGVPPHVIEAVVNHVSGHKGGVAGVYNRAEYATEKRQALDRWARHVQEIVAGTESDEPQAGA
jgi:integrase